MCETRDMLIAKAHAWAVVLSSPRWWRLPMADRGPHRSGVELGLWTSRQVRGSGLCTSCWFRESAPDIGFCDGGDCRNFTGSLRFWPLVRTAAGEPARSARRDRRPGRGALSGHLRFVRHQGGCARPGGLDQDDDPSVVELCGERLERPVRHRLPEQDGTGRAAGARQRAR
ncbi:hypothetical protein C9F11_45310 (plasmid) [Streptomyces sp. YIM 121038]|uniref:hypothetical protein n=1 Tax=Streptomyces sp. YIM 121038 TaxID=2136401 RepID=UPI0011630833|nr:hypothetical protein [Streptomyces sp. YIM 121038]QCX82622.1 hypothetical protein C9F11_45310 [Streptomyces sp. YIM 121038]